MEDILNKLSTREKEVYSFLRFGHTNKEIAKELNISQYTVQTHINRIKFKFNVHTKRDLQFNICNYLSDTI